MTVVRIADDGPGLPQDVSARVFQRTSFAGNNGYGLSIARELAERNGAFLDLANTASGTEFTIELQGVEATPESAAFTMFEAA